MADSEIMKCDKGVQVCVQYHNHSAHSPEATSDLTGSSGVTHKPQLTPSADRSNSTCECTLLVNTVCDPSKPVCSKLNDDILQTGCDTDDLSKLQSAKKTYAGQELEGGSMEPLPLEAKTQDYDSEEDNSKQPDNEAEGAEGHPDTHSTEHGIQDLVNRMKMRSEPEPEVTSPSQHTQLHNKSCAKQEIKPMPLLQDDLIYFSDDDQMNTSTMAAGQGGQSDSDQKGEEKPVEISLEASLCNAKDHTQSSDLTTTLNDVQLNTIQNMEERPEKEERGGTAHSTIGNPNMLENDIADQNSLQFVSTCIAKVPSDRPEGSVAPSCDNEIPHKMELESSPSDTEAVLQPGMPDLPFQLLDGTQPPLISRESSSLGSVEQTSSEFDNLDDEYMDRLLGKLDSPHPDSWQLLDPDSCDNFKGLAQTVDFSSKIMDPIQGRDYAEFGYHNLPEDIPEDERCPTTFTASYVASGIAGIGESIFDKEVYTYQAIPEADESNHEVPVAEKSDKEKSEITLTAGCYFGLVSEQIISKEHQQALDILNLSQKLKIPSAVDKNTLIADARNKSLEYLKHVTDTQRYQFLANRNKSQEEQRDASLAETQSAITLQANLFEGDQNFSPSVPSMAEGNEEPPAPHTFRTVWRGMDECSDHSDNESNVSVSPCGTPPPEHVPLTNDILQELRDRSQSPENRNKSESYGYREEPGSNKSNYCLSSETGQKHQMSPYNDETEQYRCDNEFGSRKDSDDEPWSPGLGEGLQLSAIDGFWSSEPDEKSWSPGFGDDSPSHKDKYEKHSTLEYASGDDGNRSLQQQEKSVFCGLTINRTNTCEETTPYYDSHGYSETRNAEGTSHGGPKTDDFSIVNFSGGKTDKEFIDRGDLQNPSEKDATEGTTRIFEKWEEGRLAAEGNIKMSDYDSPAFQEYRTQNTEDVEDSDHSSDEDFSSEVCSRKWQPQGSEVSTEQERNFRPTPAPRQRVSNNRAPSNSPVRRETPPIERPASWDTLAFTSYQFKFDQHQSTLPSEPDCTGVQQMKNTELRKCVGDEDDLGKQSDEGGDLWKQLGDRGDRRKQMDDGGERAMPSLVTRMTESPASAMTMEGSTSAGLHQKRLNPRLSQPANLLDSSLLKGDKNCSDMLDTPQRGLYPSLSDQQTRNEDAIREEKTREGLSEELRTIEVTGLQEDDEEMCRLYFENSKRSGGGECDDDDGITWDGEKQCFLLTFADSEVAKRVASRDHHLKQGTIQVKLHSPPCCYDDRMHLMGVPGGTSEDCLKNYLECVADITVTDLKLNKEAGEAVVMLEPGSLDLKHFRQACNSSPLDSNSLMTFQSVPVVLPNTVLVRNLKPSTTKDCVSVFFQNKKRNAGGPVTSVDMLDDTTALVHFQHHEDAESVVKKGDHSLDGHQLLVALQDPQVVPSFSTSEDKRVTKEGRVLEPMELDEPFQTDACHSLENGEAEQDRKQRGDLYHNEKNSRSRESNVHKEMISRVNRRDVTSSGQTAWGTGNITNSQPVRQSSDSESPTRMTNDSARGHTRDGDTWRYATQAEKSGNLRSGGVRQPSNSGAQCHKQPGVNRDPASGKFYSRQASFNTGLNPPGHAQTVYQSPSATATRGATDHSQMVRHFEPGIEGKRWIPAGRGKGHQNSSSAAYFVAGSPHDGTNHSRSHTRYANDHQTGQVAHTLHEHTTIRLGADVITRISESQEQRKKFVECLKRVNGRYQLEWPDCVVITCVQDKAPVDWKSTVHKAVEKFALVISVELGAGMGLTKPGVPPQRSLVMSAIPTEKAAGYQVTEGRPPGFRSQSNGDGSHKNIPMGQQAKEERPLMPRGQTTGEKSYLLEDVAELKPLQVKFWSVPQAKEKVQTVYPMVKFFVEHEVLKMSAPKELIHKAKSDVLNFLLDLSEKKIMVSGSVYQMYKLARAQEKINRLINTEGLICYWELQDACISVIASGKDQKRLDDLFCSTFTETEVKLGGDEISVMRSVAWQTFMEKIQCSDEGQTAPVLLPDLGNNVLFVCDTPSNISKTRCCVQKFFDANKPEEEKYRVDLNRLKFLRSFCAADLRVLHDKAKLLGAVFNIDENGVVVRGPKNTMAQVISHIKELVGTIISDQMTFKTHGTGKYFKRHEAQEFLQNVGEMTKCLVTLSNDQFSDSTGPAHQVLAQVMLPTGGKMVIMQGDITQCKVGAVVNAANDRLEHGGGVAAAIVKAGGYSIQTESRKIVAAHGPVPEGQVVDTTGGNLRCSHVLHAVGPVWRGGSNDEEKVLMQTVHQILMLAQKLELPSVAIPAVSCGIFRYPVRDATMAIVRTIAQFFTAENLGSLKMVILIDIGPEPLRGFLSAAKTVFGKQLEMRAEPTVTTRGARKENYTCQVRSDAGGYHSHFHGSSGHKSGLPVKIISGEIAKSRADVIVSTIHPSLDLQKGVLSKCILEEGGEEIQQELQQFSQRHGSARLGSVVRTRGGRLKCRSVFHVSLPTWRDDRGKAMRSAVKECLDTAKKQKAMSIAFPALGTGKLGYPGSEVATIMNSVFEEWFGDNHHGLNEVQVIVYPKDTETLQAFKSPGQRGSMHQGERHGRGEKRGHEDRGASGGPSRAKTRVGKLTVMVKQGNILSEPCDAIVNSSNDALDLNKGAVSKSIKEACGDDILVECRRQRGEMEEQGVAVTRVESGKLGCGTIIHVSSDRFKGDWRKGILQALKTADKLGLRSVSFPALGTSMRGANPKELAQGMRDALAEFSDRAHSVREVRVVVFQQPIIAHYIAAFDPDAEPRGAEASVSDSEDTTQTERMPEKSASVYIYSNKRENIDAARARIHKHIKESQTERTLNDPLISSFRPDQQSAVTRLQMKHDVDIELKVKDGRLKVRGFEKDVMETVSDIKDLLIKANTQRHLAAGMPAVRWQYEVGQDKFHDFDPENIISIEAAYKNKDKFVHFKDKRGRMYKIVFKEWREYSVDDKSAAPVKIRRRDMLHEKSHEIPLPSHWEPMKGEKVKLVELNPSSNEFKRVQEHFGNQTAIIKIQRVQNPTLFQQYKVKKKELEKFNPKGTENEKRLWHGTSSDVIKSIITNGFNRSYCGKNGTALGAGVYFAANSATSMGYASGRQMFQARVLTGEYTPGNGSMRMSPNKPSGDRPYDSVTDGRNPPGVHVIFHDSQAYPEYLLTF